ncbi:hypothetical protein I0C86_16335 [Plantactinospora sp. S1510]|uniref:OmpR/PhoB-type domain-containing protein n=1 Tax=Plantactinospora alkalitolerans TaxID=2789879 RepID=A0ABS0GWF5_9ACTN|nr:BTAD domain-containing putative transcriptional regulator [Plantactinospora alkalitolerans]MBF9130517.1 hypothetical protein [Plantactinospora alkalitolerans]
MVGRRQERCLLGLLLLEASRPVPIPRLVDLLWHGEPPATATAVLSTYVSRLRTALNSGADGCGDALVRRGDGYALEIDVAAVDAHRFVRLVEQARTAVGVERSRLLREALGLWRGTPLADAATPLRERVCAGLDRLRRSAMLLRIETDLALGGHEELLGELTELVERDPLDETLAGHLMIALYRAGRRQDALQTYHRTRERLAEALGLDPGHRLGALARAILRADPVLDPCPVGTDTDTDRDGNSNGNGNGNGNGNDPSAPPAGNRAATYDGVPPRPLGVPAQLPPKLSVFVGRDPELDQLDAALLPGRDEPTGVLIAVVSGTAGVGKTTLAVHWAHRQADRFPDGQLHVDLRGFEPTGSVLEPARALRGFLTALGVPPQRIPAELVEQAALYRSLLTGRRMLIMLDNAADAEQVHPLLPGSPGCAVIVTSRNRLSGLVATAGARPLLLDLPPAAEARQLLIRRIGADRVAAEPAAVDELISHCARLPLALAVAAARTAANPTFPLRALARELRSTDSRLAGFADGDTGTDVRAVFSWSYQTLSPPAARLFRLLGLHPGPNIGTSAAASLLGVPVEEVRPSLAELSRANLLVERTPGRYGCHDLLRAYSAELARELEPEAERAEAIRRVLDHYLRTAHAAARSWQFAWTIAPGWDPPDRARSRTGPPRPDPVAGRAEVAHGPPACVPDPSTGTPFDASEVAGAVRRRWT